MFSDYRNLQDIKEELCASIEALYLDIKNMSDLERPTKKDGGNFTSLKRNFPDNISFKHSITDDKVSYITIHGRFDNYRKHNTVIYFSAEEAECVDSMYNKINEELKSTRIKLKEYDEGLKTLDSRLEQLDSLINQFNKDLKELSTNNDSYILREYAGYKIRFN